VAVDVGGEAELAREGDGRGLGVAEQDRGAVAAVVGLARLAAPAAVGVAVVERRLAQHVPVAREDLDVADADAGVAGQVASRQLEADPLPVDVLVVRWHRLPACDPDALRKDLDEIQDADV
jgi:hypothetical protein